MTFDRNFRDIVDSDTLFCYLDSFLFCFRLCWIEDIYSSIEIDFYFVQLFPVFVCFSYMSSDMKYSLWCKIESIVFPFMHILHTLSWSKCLERTKDVCSERRTHSSNCCSQSEVFYKVSSFHKAYIINFFLYIPSRCVQ